MKNIFLLIMHLYNQKKINLELPTAKGYNVICSMGNYCYNMIEKTQIMLIY